MTKVEVVFVKIVETVVVSESAEPAETEISTENVIVAVVGPGMEDVKAV